MVPRFSFLPPSCGDRLLAQATTLELKLHRWPAESPLAGEHDDNADRCPDRDAENGAEVSYELKGELLTSGADAANLVTELLAEFRRPARGGKGGGA